jgi:hypothetical protein
LLTAEEERTLAFLMRPLKVGGLPFYLFFPWTWMLGSWCCYCIIYV